MSYLVHIRRFKKACNRLMPIRRENGFASTEWIALMGFTIVIFAAMVQGLYIENVRQTTFAFLNDSARAGARMGDVRAAIDTPSSADDNVIISECITRMLNAIAQSTGMDSSTVNCRLDIDPSNRAYVEATVGPDFQNVSLIPLAEVFRPRLENLNARYYPVEEAK